MRQATTSTKTLKEKLKGKQGNEWLTVKQKKSEKLKQGYISDWYKKVEKNCHHISKLKQNIIGVVWQWK